MQSGSAPIGFEGIVSTQTNSLIGFEQFEVEQQESVRSAYPLDDVMPNPNQFPQNNHIHSHDPPFVSNALPSSSHTPKHNTHSSISTRKSLPHPQVLAAYREIINNWCKVQWLTFVDNRTETYLTLDSKTNELLTVQSALNQYHLTSGKTFIRSQPECLLIQTKSKTKTIFVPNPIISLEHLCDKHISQKLFPYKLMAMICHSNETNSKWMFYKDFQSNSWYIYYDQSTLSPAHSNILSNEEQYQLESFIQQLNHIDLSKLISPLSALCNHPIIYVYVPETTKETT